MKRIILLVFVGVISFGKIEAQVNVQDSLALVDLYNSTDGANWTNNYGWLTNSPVSTWEGVQVDGNRVSELALEANNLKGKLPSSVGNLTGLIVFELDHNLLLGKIPSSISNLINLKSFILGENFLSGNVPSFLKKLISINYLDLSYNKFSGTIPAALRHFSHLGSIQLDGNEFTFAGLEQLIKAYPGKNIGYHDQAKIPLNYNSDTFSVSAGGTLAKETFFWYKNDSLVAKIIGDSTYKSIGVGKYNVFVINKIATELELFSTTDTLRRNSFSTGILKNKIFSSLILYPNPSTDKINLVINASQNENAQIEIIDMQGKVVASSNKNIVAGSSTQSINISSLAKGNYFISIKTSEGETSEKFVKE